MLNLIYKDIMLVKKENLLLLAYAVFIGVIGMVMPYNPGVLYSLAVFMMAYFAMLYNIGYDDRNNGYVIISSLPVTRASIVISKYLFLTAYTTFAWAVVSIATNILPAFGIHAAVRTGNVSDLIVSLSAVILFSSIYYPIYFKFGYVKMKMFSTVMYYIILISPSFIPKYLKAQQGTSFMRYLSSPSSCLKFEMYIFVAAIVFLIISVFLSINVYEKRDL